MRLAQLVLDVELDALLLEFATKGGKPGLLLARFTVNETMDVSDELEQALEAWSWR